MAGYTRQSEAEIASGQVIEASDFNNEYNAIQTAFANSNGHSHDGTAGEGAPITKIGPGQEYNANLNDFSPESDNAKDLGTSSKTWKNLFLDGEIHIDGQAIFATASELNNVSGTASVSNNVSLVNSDSVVINDSGTMKQVPLSSVATYMNGKLTSTGALTGGSIGLGFGTIITNNIISTSSSISTTSSVTTPEVNRTSLGELKVNSQNGNLTLKSQTGQLNLDAHTKIVMIETGHGSNDEVLEITSTAGDVTIQMPNHSKVLRFKGLNDPQGNASATSHTLLELINSTTAADSVVKIPNSILQFGNTRISDKRHTFQAATQGTLFEVPKEEVHAIKAVVSTSKGNNIHVSEITVTYRNNNAIITEFGIINTGNSDLHTLDADIDGNNLRVRYTPSDSTDHVAIISATEHLA